MPKQPQYQSNGNEPQFIVEPSPLVAIRAEFVAAGGKVDPAKASALQGAFVKAQAKVEAAEAALAVAKAECSIAARALMVATNAAPLKIGGKILTAAGRQGNVFYKTASGEALEIK